MRVHACVYVYFLLEILYANADTHWIGKRVESFCSSLIDFILFFTIRSAFAWVFLSISLRFFFTPN